jgi:hypothetical protein
MFFPLGTTSVDYNYLIFSDVDTNNGRLLFSHMIDNKNTHTRSISVFCPDKYDRIDLLRPIVFWWHEDVFSIVFGEKKMQISSQIFECDQLWSMDVFVHISSM